MKGTTLVDSTALDALLFVREWNPGKSAQFMSSSNLRSELRSNIGEVNEQLHVRVIKDGGVQTPLFKSFYYLSILIE